jgi:hypothetical protein
MLMQVKEAWADGGYNRVSVTWDDDIATKSVDFELPLNKSAGSQQLYVLVKYYFLLAIEAGYLAHARDFFPVNQTFVQHLTAFYEYYSPTSLIGTVSHGEYTNVSSFIIPHPNEMYIPRSRRYRPGLAEDVYSNNIIDLSEGTFIESTSVSSVETQKKGRRTRSSRTKETHTDPTESSIRERQTSPFAPPTVYDDDYIDNKAISFLELNKENLAHFPTSAGCLSGSTVQTQDIDNRNSVHSSSLTILSVIARISTFSSMNTHPQQRKVWSTALNNLLLMVAVILPIVFLRRQRTTQVPVTHQC